MRYRFLQIFHAVLGAAVLSSCDQPVADSAAPEAPAKIVVALEPDKDPDAMLADRRALETYLSDALGQPVEAIIPLTTAVITEGLKNGTIDLAYLSSTATARLMESGSIDVLLANLIDGKPSYQSYWLALKESPYETIRDLEGRPIAFSSRTSTSGFLIPTWDLYKQGLITREGGPEAFFGEDNVSYGVGYVSAVERVLDGSVEAAAVSYYVFEEDKHLSQAQRDRLKVVDTQGPVPSHVLVVRKSLSESAQASLEAAFLAMNADATELRDRLFGSALAPADADTHLEVTREALDVVGDMPL